MKKVHSSSRTAADKSARAESVDDYLAALPEEKRVTLEKLRRIIKAIVPDATEVISYRMPVFKYKGRPLVAFAAFKNHCSFYPMSPKVLRDHAAELNGYDLATGTIRFSVDNPLPVALVKKLVKARIAENEGARKKK